jgi:hypothetical protein
MDLPTFYRVIVAISRGCPSTGWMLALGSAHALQAASYFGQAAQDGFFSGKTSSAGMAGDRRVHDPWISAP